jgi:hypothetical protein
VTLGPFRAFTWRDTLASARKITFRRAAVEGEVNNIDQADEKVFSPAALRIIRRHRPDPEDGRYCRGCGRPAGACDVLALARSVASDLRVAQTHAQAADEPTRDSESAFPGEAATTVRGSRPKVPRHPGRRQTDRAPIEA